jgi:hypothetical protein
VRREKAEQAELSGEYLTAFGYDGKWGDGRWPKLKIEVLGHIEADGHTWYEVKNTLTLPYLVEEISWLTFKRLWEFRAKLHDPIKKSINIQASQTHKYSSLFSKAPFARHGGLPGTTHRLSEWSKRLTSLINNGDPCMTKDLIAMVLKFVDSCSRRGRINLACRFNEEEIENLQLLKLLDEDSLSEESNDLPSEDSNDLAAQTTIGDGDNVINLQTSYMNSAALQRQDGNTSPDRINPFPAQESFHAERWARL